MDANITVRMPRDLYDRLVSLAGSDRRRIGEYVRILLEDAVPILEHQRDGRTGQASAYSVPAGDQAGQLASEVTGDQATNRVD